ncbi:MAG: Holliday junction branch migration protein RuvA [Alphaproteobacteria bacterium]|jgi:Holliday junction DNA helicase RuvA
MIAKLKGILDSTADGFLILDVNGVGYRVFCSAKTLAKMPPAGQPAVLLIETQVREDHIHLFGFADAAEKGWFSLLTTVQGVGAKVALAILSVLSGEELSMAVASGDSKSMTRAPGVGPKLAVRIVTELKGKGFDAGIAAGVAGPSGEAAPEGVSVVGDAVSALVNLGYARMDAAMAVNRAYKKRGAGASVSDLIRDALKDFAP